jgi:hypothetical protein
MMMVMSNSCSQEYECYGFKNKLKIIETFNNGSGFCYCQNCNDDSQTTLPSYKGFCDIGIERCNQYRGTLADNYRKKLLDNGKLCPKQCFTCKHVRKSPFTGKKSKKKNSKKKSKNNTEELLQLTTEKSF